MDKSNQLQSWSRSCILLFAAFAFAFCVGIGVHEWGHAFALHLFGVHDVKVILHPFGASRTVWNTTNEYLGYVDAAGPLMNIVLATALFIPLWRWRRALLLPLLLWAPMAYIQEGFNTAMQLAFRVRGSDALRMVAAGTPAGLLLGIATLLMVIGVMTMCCLLPLLGLSARDRFLKRLALLVPGFSAYMLLILVYAWAIPEADVKRGVFLVAFAILLAFLIALLSVALRRWTARFYPFGAEALSWAQTWTAVVLATATVCTCLLWFNP